MTPGVTGRSPGFLGMTVGEIATVVQGTVVGADVTAAVRDVVIDSRAARSGSLFVALPGEHVDGHDFAAAALQAGAAVVLASRDIDVPHVRVSDPVVALGAIAAAYRRQISATIIGVTGSAGKTATKDLLAALLPALGPTVASPGSFNNDIGLPLTILSAPSDTRFLVLEMGARAQGDIARLCAIAAPDIGVVLNVGSAHLGEFGSREAIAQAKGELVEHASKIAVLNAADPLVAAMASRAGGAIRTFGVADTCPDVTRVDVEACDVSVGSDGRASFLLRTGGEQARVSLRLVGAHQVWNAVAAAAVASACGLGIADIAAILSAAEPASHWRMEMRERADGVTVVNDAYNANPESMRAAIDALVALGGPGRRSWAALGQMLELGESSEREHEAIGRYATTQGVDGVVAVDAPAIARGAGPQAFQVPDVQAAITLLAELLRPGDVLLIKASRGARLERLAEAVLGDEVGQNGPMRPPHRGNR